MIRWGEKIGHPCFILTRDVEAEMFAVMRWFTDTGEKHESWVNHAIWLLLDLTTIVEALFPRVKEGTLEACAANETTWGVIVGIHDFSTRRHAIADLEATRTIGKPYNVVSIVKQALDGLVGKLVGHDWYGFRRIRLPWVKAYICSEAVARSAKKAKWLFSGLVKRNVKERWGNRFRLRSKTVLRPLSPRRVAPDCLWDDVFEHRPALYYVAGEINPELRPAHLPAAVVAALP